jgi:hypothetical protein
MLVFASTERQVFASARSSVLFDAMTVPPDDLL